MTCFLVGLGFVGAWEHCVCRSISLMHVISFTILFVAVIVSFPLMLCTAFLVI